jgi:hypothetical protein
VACASEPVVVERPGGQPVGVGHQGGPGPWADAEGGLGLGQAVGDEDLDRCAEGDVTLPGDESVDGGGEAELLEGAGDGRQGGEDPDLEAGVGVPVRLSWVTERLARFARRAARMLPPRV